MRFFSNDERTPEVEDAGVDKIAERLEGVSRRLGGRHVPAMSDGPKDLRDNIRLIAETLGYVRNYGLDAGGHLLHSYSPDSRYPDLTRKVKLEIALACLRSQGMEAEDANAFRAALGMEPEDDDDVRTAESIREQTARNAEIQEARLKHDERVWILLRDLFDAVRTIPEAHSALNKAHFGEVVGSLNRHFGHRTIRYAEQGETVTVILTLVKVEIAANTAGRPWAEGVMADTAIGGTNFDAALRFRIDPDNYPSDVVLVPGRKFEMTGTVNRHAIGGARLEVTSVTA